jgi:hypothetical protein
MCHTLPSMAVAIVSQVQNRWTDKRALYAYTFPDISFLEAGLIQGIRVPDDSSLNVKICLRSARNYTLPRDSRSVRNLL